MAVYDTDGATEVIALCPTRENAKGALGMVESFYATVRRSGTEVILVIDANDPQRADYEDIPRRLAKHPVGMGITRPDPPRIMVVEGGTLTKATNEAIDRILAGGPLRDAIVGHVGDDHRFRTEGWDSAIRDALLEMPGVAYAFDGFRSAWASAWWTNLDIIRTLGWLAVPGSMHLTIDDVFMDIGAGLGATPQERLQFLGDILIEHEHPAGGKVEWRPIVASHYAKDRRAKEEANLARYRAEDFANDITRLRDALGLAHYPITDLSPGVTFRKALREYEYAAVDPDPEPPENVLLEMNGGKPLKIAERLRLTNQWKREWRNGEHRK